MDPLPNEEAGYRARVSELAQALFKPVRSNYIRGPVNRVRVLEALNALAIVAATVIRGCDGVGGEAEAFFNHTLAICLKNVPVDGGNLEDPNPTD